MQKKKETSSEELYGELDKRFDFTRGDLEANRAGFISFAQKADFDRARFTWAFTMFATGFVLALCSVFILINFISFAITGFAMDSRAMMQFFMSLMSLFIILLFGLIFIWAFVDYREAKQNSLETRVQVYNGFAAYQHEKKAQWSAEESKLLQARPNLRIYATPGTKRILSCEFVLPE